MGLGPCGPSSQARFSAEGFTGTTVRDKCLNMGLEEEEEGSPP